MIFCMHGRIIISYSLETLFITASGMFNCQVFYHKEGTNHWRATLAFFPKEKMTIKVVAMQLCLVQFCAMLLNTDGQPALPGC